jgi:alpha-tubulin suppressor-like RCC1 family protein
VFVSPDTAILVPAGTFDFQAVVRGPLFEPLSDRYLTWAVGDLNVATVSPTGHVDALLPGATSVRAQSDGVTGSATVMVTRPSFVALASGSRASHACGLTAAGAVFCWGSNYIGQLGIGIADRGLGFLSGRLVPTGVVRPRTFAAVALGDYFTCGIAGAPSAAMAYCWGGGADGTLGNGGVESSVVPAPVQTGVRFTSVSSGWNHSCAIATDSAAYCWGRPPGIGTLAAPRAFTPAPVDGGLKFLVLGTGAHLTCGLASDSLAYCWGNVIGNDTASGALGPHPVSGRRKYVTITVGEEHACGIDAGGSTYCWGSNFSGQLGDGTTDTATAPSPVSGGVAFASLTAGAASTCGLTSSGIAYCWGLNSSGQLGTSTIETCSSQPCSTTPVAVSGGLTFRALAAGFAHVCGLTTGGVVYCWGANDAGQLGDGTRTNRPTPTRLLGQP